MFCPICGRTMTGPANPSSVPFPMFVCGHDGVVYDRKRDTWHGLPEIGEKLICPICGGVTEVEPKEPPFRVYFCYQCGVTFDKESSAWFGLAYHLGP